MSETEILSARAVRFGNQRGTAYRVLRPHAFTGDAALDRALSTVRTLVFTPENRDPAEAPVVTLLQGITAPLERSGALVGPLLDAGFGVVAFDTPLGGERRLGTGPRGSEVAEFGRRSDLRLDLAFADRLFDGVASDFGAVLGVAAQKHGLAQATEAGGRLALFGVSFGCLLSALAFGRDGLGARLVGACGHPDVAAMARGLARSAAGWANVPEALVGPALAAGPALVPVLEKAARARGGDTAVGALRLAALMARIGRGGRRVEAFNPAAFADRVSAERPVWLLTGQEDTVATPDETRASAALYAAHETRVVPGLGHGWRHRGPGSFAGDCTVWTLDALADWRLGGWRLGAE